MELEVARGDITRLRVHAVVNAANSRMRGGGGVDGAIHRSAGPGLLRECVERFPDGLPTGSAGWTGGHGLPARWVIHVVGPVYDGVGANRPLLVSCYAGALAVADDLAAEHGVEDFSIAFPLVSAGVYGWPRDDAARVAVETLRGATTRVARAVVVAFDDEMVRLVAGHLDPGGATDA